ncbi:uncharacterized protein LOC129320806 isoform X2 [Prosopis cineraria]|uniref:uncharacterized protein LOC129320806 isoform X2 n=1 Tax=Prosopis cineraria TaxID=364024 RepID=UPI002410B5BD|nr:uncharacterized protein LOC129320806 isoform X2 [Prosopis cineraria]
MAIYHGHDLLFFRLCSLDHKVIDKKASLKNDSPLKSPNPTISPLKNTNENFSPILTSRTSTPQQKSTKSSPCVGNVHSNLLKVPLNIKTRYDRSTTWDGLPPILCNLGKVQVKEPVEDEERSRARGCL